MKIQNSPPSAAKIKAHQVNVPSLLIFYLILCLLTSFITTIPQIIFDGFTVGRFDEGVADSDFETTDASLMLSTSGAELPGCPDGFMQV